MRLAYADPPYPGKAHLYENHPDFAGEVDHRELLDRLSEYDGWALSTDEPALAYVLSLCPPGTRVLAWCRTNAPPYPPFPWAAWEPVLLSPARTTTGVRSYHIGAVPSGRAQKDGLTGQKTEDFCEWVLRCLGAELDDTLDDLFPGTGIMGRVWDRFQLQPPLFTYVRPQQRSHKERINMVRRIAEPLPGMAAPPYAQERRKYGSG